MMYRCAMKLHNFDIDHFLTEYWQKKPLLIRSGFADFDNPLEPDELAGLACEEEIESRLIISSDGYKMTNGPFDGDDFAALENKIYTLLVQAVDHHIPDVSTMLNPFRFIPNWRIDDVMVSYANTGGGVGPHFDQYDVFLVQGLGQRRWQIGQICDADTALLPHDDLRLLADFKAKDEWILGVGDILYVPPMVAHNGVSASDDCMTYSVGFRAPSQSELIAGYCDHLLDETNQDVRFRDLNYRGQSHSGAIDTESIDALHALMMEKLRNRDDFAQWFGRYNSESKYPHMTPQIDESETNDSALPAGTILCRNPASRFSYIEQNDNIILFVDGAQYICAHDDKLFIQSLCGQEPIIITADISIKRVFIINNLIARGALALE